MANQKYSRRLHTAVRCGATILALGAGGAAYGQGDASDTPPGVSEVTLEEILVTGTRIRGAAPVGSTMIAVGRDEIETSGNVTIDRLLHEVPQIYDLGVSENSRGQTGGNGNIVYGNTVNLRGIGPYATLVIVDGHRVVNNSRSTDPSVMPTLGVERIEVVADGASAIYGSDAVAGVVNIIPRRSLDGAEFLARYGFSEADGFDEYQIGAAYGEVWDSGQFMVAYEHVYRSNLSGDDRDFFTSDQRSFGGDDYRLTECNPGTITLDDGTTYAIPEIGLTQANAGSLTPGTANLCEGRLGQDLFPEQEYDSVNATFTQELTDWLTVFADGFYSKRNFVRHSGYVSTTLNVPSTNAFFVAPPGFTGNSYTVGYSFKDDLPRNQSSGFAKSWQITPGVRVDLPYTWQMEATLSYGRTHDVSNSFDDTNRGALGAALASSDPANAFDPYGLNRTAQPVLDGISNQIFLAPTINRFTGYEAEFDGPVVDIPGGEVKLALGYEGQEWETHLGIARGAPDTPISFRVFTRRVDSVYAELLIPVFGADNATTGFQRLDINAAVRYDDYDDVGNTTNPKVGVNWLPIPELTIRGSYGTSFRAPLISQIYGNSCAMFFQRYQNPEGGAPLPGFAQSCPNLGLSPETATTWSIGADWEPTDSLRFSLTYFSVDYENQVETHLSNLSILALEDDFAGTGIILRDEDATNRMLELISQGVPVLGPIPGGDPANVDLFVDGRNHNLGQSNTRGIDFQATYWFETADMGTFNFDINGTYLTSYEVAVTAVADKRDRLNEIFQPLEFRGRGVVTWEKDPVTVRMVGRYVGSYTNTTVTPHEKVSSHTPIDISLFWRVGDPGSSDLIKSGFVLGLEVQDVFDEGPPYVNFAPSGNGGGGYDPTVASPIGRLFAVTLRKKW